MKISRLLACLLPLLNLQSNNYCQDSHFYSTLEERMKTMAMQWVKNFEFCNTYAKYDF